MILVIDNYDSFTYNLVQIMGEGGVSLKVVRNDEVSLADIRSLRPDGIVLSPGPGHPKDSKITLELAHGLDDVTPILGVCLGHQALALAHGGKVVKASRLLHGKTSKVYHDQKTLFQGLSNPFEATRYHSLIVEEESLPDSLMVTAWTSHGEIMGLRHRELPLEGVQFHPESVLTQEGPRLLQNFIDLVASYRSSCR